MYLSNTDFSFVHKLNDSRDVGVRSVSQYNDLILLVELEEKRFKVRAASRQDNLVRTYCPSFGSYEYVSELFCAEKSGENAKQVVLMIVPAQTVLLTI